MVGRSTLSGIVESWRVADHKSAFLEADHEVIDATWPLREVVVEALLRADGAPGDGDRDLFHACGALGRALAEKGGSPSFAAGTVDRLFAVLESDGTLVSASVRPSPSLALSMRASIFESYVFALMAGGREDARRGWAYPACVVPLEDGAVTVAAGHPTEDAEALASWASGVAHALSLGGVRRALVSGSPEAVGALTEALDIAGIRCVVRASKLSAARPLVAKK
jgi:hypothetical protein